MSKFYNLSDDTKNDFISIFRKKNLPVDIRFEFVGNEKQKQLIKITKIPDQYSFVLEKDILIVINEDLMNVFDDESVTILFEQEIDKVVVESESGKIKLVKPDLSTFSSLINKYGVDKIAKANQIEELYHQQKQDSQTEFLV